MGLLFQQIVQEWHPHAVPDKVPGEMPAVTLLQSSNTGSGLEMVFWACLAHVLVSSTEGVKFPLLSVAI